MNSLVTVVDIETEAKTVDAVICSVGAVVVNVFTGEEISEFYEICEITSQTEAFDRVVDKSTQDWWLSQREEYPSAFADAFDPDLPRESLQDVLHEFNEWVSKHCGNRPLVMGNGPEFDNAILTHAMDYFGIEPCWDYGCNQSLRTVVMMGRMLLGFDPKYDLEFDGEKHIAIDDARHEAKYLIEIFSEFQKHLPLFKTKETAES